MKDDAVVFKGTKEGLLILLEEQAPFDIIRESIIHKLDSGRSFFNGGKISVAFKGKKLNENEKKELKSILYDQYEMDLTEAEEQSPRNSVMEEDKSRIDMQTSASEGVPLIPGSQEGQAIFIRNTVRNGQRICYNGNVVIVGDVNPGAEIIAGGNIVVMGNLRGMAHAGAWGDQQACVAAFNLQPTQLRIESIITRPPEDDRVGLSYPELARIKDGVIIIEPYLPSRGR